VDPPSVPATTAIAPELLMVTEFTLATAVAGRVMETSRSGETDVTTPFRLQVNAAVSMTSFDPDTAGITAPPVNTPFGLMSGALPSDSEKYVAEVVNVLWSPESVIAAIKYGVTPDS
jgi:hypothetical protein